MIRDRSGITLVKTADIDWIDGCGNYLEITANGKKHLHRETMKGILKRLDSRVFARVHRSIIVNLEKISEVKTVAKGAYHLVMSNGDEVPTNLTLREIEQLLGG